MDDRAVVHNRDLAKTWIARSLVASASVLGHDYSGAGRLDTALPTAGQRWRQRQREWLHACEAAAAVAVTRTAVEIARAQGMVLTTGQARRTGLTAATLRRLVHEGMWTAPRRGVLCVLPGADERDPFPHGWRPEIRAAAAALVRPESSVSHESSALMFALPALRWPPRPILTAFIGNGEGRPDALIHRAGLDAEEVTNWFGVAVTRPARTVIDIARDSGLRAGLVVADAALADGLVSVSELDAALVTKARWPGVRTARRVVELASPLAESPLETLSRLLVLDAGLPVPELQAVVHTRGGRYRVDALWRDQRVILEADGMLKYATPADLRAEKVRQENLERAGYVVIRVTWDDVMHRPAETARRIEAALRAASHGR